MGKLSSLSKLLALAVFTLFLLVPGSEARGRTFIQLCPPSLFDALDLNGDNSISMHEYASFSRDKVAASNNFLALDQNRDGVLRKQDAETLFIKLDRNADQLLDQEELMQRWQVPRFRHNLSKAAEDLEILDFNRDGAVVFDEFSRNWLGLAMIAW